MGRLCFEPARDGRSNFLPHTAGEPLATSCLPVQCGRGWRAPKWCNRSYLPKSPSPWVVDSKQSSLGSIGLEAPDFATREICAWNPSFFICGVEDHPLAGLGAHRLHKQYPEQALCHLLTATVRLDGKLGAHDELCELP